MKTHELAKVLLLQQNIEVLISSTDYGNNLPLEIVEYGMNLEGDSGQISLVLRGKSWKDKLLTHKSEIEANNILSGCNKLKITDS